MINNFPSNLNEWLYCIKKWLKKILPQQILKIYYLLFPFIGCILFAFPSHKIRIIGVTGTDGKSSVVIFISRILREAGYRVGFSSSIFFGDGEKEYLNEKKVTMPGRFFIQQFLKRLVKNKCQYAVIEVTSEGIKQQRHRCIDFDCLIITNITKEHIESHGGFENYKKAKAEIFQNLKFTFSKGVPKTIIVNADCPESIKFLQYPANRKLKFGIRERSADVKATIIHNDLEKTEFFLSDNKESIKITPPLYGPFIVENVLAAATIARAFGIEFSIIKSAIERIQLIPGRFEIISRKPFVIVDYAHTVFAFKKLLEYLRNYYQGRIIHVFGAAGGIRDKWKRPVLGKLSEKYTNFSILTEENSFDEPTEKILEEIKKGFQDLSRVLIIPVRQEAIKKAISLMKKDDLLLVTGKGCETVIVGPFGRKTPYNDKETILSLLKIS